MKKDTFEKLMETPLKGEYSDTIEIPETRKDQLIHKLDESLDESNHRVRFLSKVCLTLGSELARQTRMSDLTTEIETLQQIVNEISYEHYSEAEKLFSSIR